MDSYRLISLTSLSKVFGHPILLRVTFLLESAGSLSPFQAGFRPRRSTTDQIVYLSQSIADSLHAPKPSPRTVLATIDFNRAFDSVWYPASCPSFFL